MLRKIITLLLICVVLNVDCAKILGIFYFPSKSHHILGSALLKNLAARGHQVTMMSPFPLKTPVKNYEDIPLSGLMEHKEGNMMKNILQGQNSSTFENLSIITEQVSRVNDIFMNNAAVKDLIKSNRKFDLVILSWAWNSAVLGLAHQLDASTIVFSTVGSSVMTNSITWNPAPHSYVPNMLLNFPEEMTFLQRLGNTVSNTLFDIFETFVMTAGQEQNRQKYFPKAPPVKDLMRNVSLVLLNSHVSIESPRPHVPTMIQIGGFHVEEPKELTGDLKAFMDSAKEGVVFFSLGSNVRSADLSEDKLTAIINTFGKLPVKVLWKFENDNVPNLPSNVKIGKWLPQRDILAHPNIRVFVTHGGLLSTTEAIYHGVPMVGIPFFGDQEFNVAEGVNRGYVIKVDFLELTETALTAAIKQILNNPKYRENVQQRSKVLRDQPLKPMDNAVFWVEYVLRHKGAHHLKTSALKLEWYQYYLLDVIGILIGILLTVLIGSWIVIKKIYNLSKCLCKKKQTTQKEKQTTQKKSLTTQKKKSKLA